MYVRPLTRGLYMPDKPGKNPPLPEEGIRRNMAYLRCPECRLTAPAAAYYLRGDQCPRCLTTMEPAERFRDAPSRAATAAAAAVSGEAAAASSTIAAEPA